MFKMTPEKVINFTNDTNVVTEAVEKLLANANNRVHEAQLDVLEKSYRCDLIGLLLCSDPTFDRLLEGSNYNILITDTGEQIDVSMIDGKLVWSWV